MNVFRLLIPLCYASWLAACSSSPSPVLPPMQLEAMDNEVKAEYDWTRDVDQGAGDHYLKLQPVIVDEKMYSIDNEGHIKLLDLANDKIIWEKELNIPVSSALSLYQDTLYVGSSQGEVLAISAENGELAWKTTLTSEVLAPPQASANMVVVRTVDGYLYGLDRSNGAQRWNHSRNVPLLTLRGISAPVISNGVVLFGSDAGKLTALTLETGVELWEVTIAAARGRTELERIVDIDAELVVVDEVVYAVSYQGKLAAVELQSGRIYWSRDMSSYSGMVVDPYRVYLTDADGYVWALNRFNGATIWRQEKLLRRTLTRPVLQKNYLVLADFNGFVHWLSREDGHMVARARVGASSISGADSDEEFDKDNNVLVAPMVSDNRVIVVNRDGQFSQFTLQL